MKSNTDSGANRRGKEAPFDISEPTCARSQRQILGHFVTANAERMIEKKLFTVDEVSKEDVFVLVTSSPVNC